MGIPPRSNPPDFEIRKYELDRAHELELNKFSHALEVERLKILQLVNGGAFTVLLAFATGLLRSQGWFLAIFAGLCWVLGLGAAAWATQRQLDEQKEFNKAFRYRRNAIEWRRLRAIYGAQPATLMVTPLKDEEEEEATEKKGKEEEGREKTEAREAEEQMSPYAAPYDKKAAEAFQGGKAKRWSVRGMATASILLFVSGGGLLAGSLALADPSQLVQNQKAAH